MIQGNFYKRLHFYMDSCAISPTASLFVEYTEKKTSFSNSAGILGQHDIVLLADVPPPPPPEKLYFVQVATFPIFSPPKWLRMTQNGQFCPISNFSNLPTEVAQNDSEWPILPNSQLFQSFPTKVAQNDSEWPI